MSEATSAAHALEMPDIETEGEFSRITDRVMDAEILFGAGWFGAVPWHRLNLRPLPQGQGS